MSDHNLDIQVQPSQVRLLAEEAEAVQQMILEAAEEAEARQMQLEEVAVADLLMEQEEVAEHLAVAVCPRRRHLCQRMPSCEVPTRR